MGDRNVAWRVEMADRLRFFMAVEDERAFLRFVRRFELEVYPVRIPPQWTTFVAGEEAWDSFPEDAAYLAASKLGPVLVDKLKRGPDKGWWRVDEVRSPVIHFERSRTNDAGELLSGQLWAELNWTPETGRTRTAPDRFRSLVLEVEGELRRKYRRTEPRGFFVGQHAARAAKAGLVLRDSDHRGGTVKPYR